MRIFILVIALLLPSAVIAQDYGYRDYGYQNYSRPLPLTGGGYSNEQYIRDESNRIRNQINQDMRDLEVRSNIRRMDMINGGDGSGYEDRRYRYR